VPHRAEEHADVLASGKVACSPSSPRSLRCNHPALPRPFRAAPCGSGRLRALSCPSLCASAGIRCTDPLVFADDTGLCLFYNQLILDEDGVYDPTNFNDRLLLGLKGTMSEAELHVLKARLRGGIPNKVRRGEYRCVLPTGLDYDESGAVVLDPDAQVRETIAHLSA
jgi:hypothetical protein